MINFGGKQLWKRAFSLFRCSLFDRASSVFSECFFKHLRPKKYAKYGQGEKRKMSAEKIENGKGANAKTNLIGCNVDAAPKKSKYS